MFSMPLQPDQADLDAMRGIRIPSDLSSFYPSCVVYGIRHHDTLARSKEVEELCATSSMKQFARARNARLIMSNDIPNMPIDDVRPYCIWYPDVASENTYRNLARQYPDMIYSVGQPVPLPDMIGFTTSWIFSQKFPLPKRRGIMHQNQVQRPSSTVL
jgi:hypothetical protein